MKTTEKKETQQVKFIAKPYTKKSFATALGMTQKEFSAMVNEYRFDIGERLGYYYSPKQVRLIYGIFCIKNQAA